MTDYSKDVGWIIEQYLIDNGLDGLWHPYENCGCATTNGGLSPNDCLEFGCLPGVFKDCDRDEFDFMIGPKDEIPQNKQDQQSADTQEMVECPACGGIGFSEYDRGTIRYAKIKCCRCKGTGTVKDILPQEVKMVECPICDGRKTFWNGGLLVNCHRCHGTGKVTS